MTTRIAVPTSDGEMPALLWTPASGSGPGIVLLQEIFGVSSYIQRRAAALADAGYVVLAPELYWRLDQQTVDETASDTLDQAMSLVGRMDWSSAVADAVLSLHALAERDEVEGTPAVMGFCLGGGLAFNVAADADPAALVAYYGSSIPDLLGLAPQVTCPSLHHFGTADDYLPADAVRAITDAVTGDDRPARVELYDGANHAFDNDDFFLHHPEASRRAWDTTQVFLQEQLPA